ncbi:sterol desaturase family protein, partial [bacterium]|nr:sterol desaturase family protein [bacterium]
MLNYEILRLGIFISVFVGVSIWEVVAGRRQLVISKPRRWVNNLGIITLGSLLVKMVFPMLALGVALAASQKGWGLFHHLQIPVWLSGILSILLLDLTIYLQHLMFHAVPTLWRLHMVHHADLELDVSSGLRFHPLEMVLSMCIKMVVVAALGPPVFAVFIFEVLLNATAMFNHGNIHLLETLDRRLRKFVVTPDMHRVHHSVIIRETNSNFGFNFPWWDRLFGTYCAQPKEGHDGMTIGIPKFRNPKNLHLHKMLIQPFVKDK